MTFLKPANAERRIALMSTLLQAVRAEKDNPEYPLHEDRVIRHVLARWENPRSFGVLDELCGAGALRDAFFPSIPSITMTGDQFGDECVMQVTVDWMGTDGAQVTINYHKDAHARMVAERNESLRIAAEKRAAEYPPLATVLEEFEKTGRNGWIPVTETGNATDTVGSRYFGSPWMPNDAIWPLNAEDGELAFIMQINIADLPGAMRKQLGETGLVSMFYDLDVDWEPSYESPEDYEKNAVFLRFDTSVPGGMREGRKLDLAPKRIAAWKPIRDYPDHEDLVAGGDLDVAVQKFIIDQGFAPGDTHYRRGCTPTSTDAVSHFMLSAEKLWGAKACSAETAANAMDRYCAAGDKLGGWPAWDFGRRWPERDGRRLSHFFQIDIMDEIWSGFSFWRGDERAHVFFDQDDNTVFRLTWDYGNLG